MEQQFIKHINGKYQKNSHKKSNFNDIINIENFDSVFLKIDKEFYRNIDIYYIGYITTKNIGNYESIPKVIILYFIIGDVDGYIEEEN